MSNLDFSVIPKLVKTSLETDGHPLTEEQYKIICSTLVVTQQMIDLEGLDKTIKTIDANGINVDPSYSKRRKETNIVLVTGGRRNYNTHQLYEVLANIKPTLLVEGGASGVDTSVRKWGKANGVHVATISALWTFYDADPRAGPIRNRAMLQVKPDICLSCKGNKGTADMTALCLKKGIPVIYIDEYTHE